LRHTARLGVLAQQAAEFQRLAKQPVGTGKAMPCIMARWRKTGSINWEPCQLTICGMCSFSRADRVCSMPASSCPAEVQNHFLADVQHGVNADYAMQVIGQEFIRPAGPAALQGKVNDVCIADVGIQLVQVRMPSTSGRVWISRASKGITGGLYTENAADGVRF
jgi:hypothetical protein